MTVRSLALTGRGHTISPLAFATRAWFGTAAAAFLLEVLWRALRTSAAEIPIAEWSDGVLLAGIVLITSWHYVRGQELSPVKLIAVGLLWVLLSVVTDLLYRIFATNHYAVQFLMALFLGDYRGPNGWLWKLFLIVQLFGPFSIGTVKNALDTGIS